MTTLLSLFVALLVGYYYGRFAPIQISDSGRRLRARLWEWRIWHLEQQIERHRIFVEELRSQVER
jgi:hypothetical protein